MDKGYDYPEVYELLEDYGYTLKRRIQSKLIVSEIGDINRFPDSYHLCSYAGLVPSTHSSDGITYHGSINIGDGMCACIYQN